MHAKIAPSSLERIVACAGSVALSEPYMELPPDESAVEGNAAHWVLAELLAGNEHPVGTPTPQGPLVDDEMIRGAHLFKRVVVGDGPPGVSEMPVAIEWIHPTECWGTPDWWRYDDKKLWLRIADYKYGHKFVDVFENWQLMAYAAGILDMLGINCELFEVLEFIVVQPRSYHSEGPVRTWTVKAAEIRAFINRAEYAAAEALRPNARTATGIHCAHCEARHDCKTLQAAVSSVVDYVGRAERVALGAPALGIELRYLDQAAELLEARRTGLMAAGEAMLRGGTQVPGYRMGQTRGAVKWSGSLEEIAATLEALGHVGVRKPLALVTPTQAVQELGIDEAVIKAYSSTIPGRTRMEPEPIKNARKVFGANKT